MTEILAAPSAQFFLVDMRMGIMADANASPSYFTDPLNAVEMTITPSKQESARLISNMASSLGATLASIPKPTEPAKIKLKVNTMTPAILAQALNADLSQILQSAETVTDEIITTRLNGWTKLAGSVLDETESVVLKTSNNTTVDPSKYTVDFVGGFIKPLHADAVGTGMKVTYKKKAALMYQFLAGLPKQFYAQIWATGVEKVSDKPIDIRIWCAALSVSAEVEIAKGEYFVCEFDGDLIVPQGKSSPWELIRVLS